MVKHALDRDGSQDACVLKASQLPVVTWYNPRHHPEPRFSYLSTGEGSVDQVTGTLSSSGRSSSPGVPPF